MSQQPADSPATAATSTTDTSPSSRLSKTFVFTWLALAYLIAANWLGGSSALVGGLWSPSTGRLLEALPFIGVIGWEMAYHSSTAVFFTKLCGHEVHRPLLEVRPLTPAPIWLVVLSLVAYLGIGIQGVRFIMLGADSCATPALEAELRSTTLVMCAIYSLEAIVALKWDQTTMCRWARATFVLHHVPFALTVGLPLLFETTRHVTLLAYRRTVPLDLMTGLNEAIFATKALLSSQGMEPRWIELPRCCFILSLMVVLIYVETVEIAAIFTGPGSGWLKAHAGLTSLAPIYHVLDVIPSCIKGIRKGIRRLAGKGGGAESPKKNKKA